MLAPLALSGCASDRPTVAHGADRVAPVAAAPTPGPVPADTARDVAAVAATPPAAVARPEPTGKPRAVPAANVRVIGYDPRRNRAVLAVPPARPAPADDGQRDAAGRSSASPAADIVRAGDVIASAPNRWAPHGALFRVGAASRTPAGLVVSTKPATVADLLGDARVDATVPTAKLGISVRTLSRGVTAGPAAGPVPRPASPAATEPTARSTATFAAEPAAGDVATDRTRRGAAAGSAPRLTLSGRPIRLGLDVPVRVPGVTATRQGGPKLAGWVEVAPELIFSYRPGQARIGVGGRYDYGWQLHAKLTRAADTGRRPLHVPFAEVHVNTTVWVGPLPVVVEAELTYFYRITAQGSLSIDSQQRTVGRFAFGGRYDRASGWRPLQEHEARTVRGRNDEIRGSGSIKTAVGAQLAVRLYGTVGAWGRLAPYVRATIAAAPPRPVRWQLYGGFDLEGGLSLRLHIFGMPVVHRDLTFPPVRREWRIAGT